MYMYMCTCAPMCGRINDAAYSTRADKCIPRAKPKVYICLPECVDFGNVDLRNEARGIHLFARVGRLWQCRLEQRWQNTCIRVHVTCTMALRGVCVCTTHDPEGEAQGNTFNHTLIQIP